MRIIKLAKPPGLGLDPNDELFGGASHKPQKPQKPAWNYTPPKMMPGQDEYAEYAEKEYDELNTLTDKAVMDDPGEQGEEVFMRHLRREDVRYITDQLVNIWEYMSPEEMVEHLNDNANVHTRIDSNLIKHLVHEYYNDVHIRENEGAVEKWVLDRVMR